MALISANTSHGTKYFYEDEVYRHREKSGKIQFGTVLENPENATSEEESDSESLEELKPKKGELRVAWYPSGKESIVKEKNVYLADRSLIPGDVVRLENGSQKRCGYVRKVHVLASVNIVGTKHVLNDLKSEDLHPLEAFSPDIAVTFNNWVGMVRAVRSEVLLRTEDGSLCKMDSHEACKLKRFQDKKCKESEEYHDEELYPGQVLVSKLSQLDCVTWLKRGPQKGNAITAPFNSKKRGNKKITLQVEEINALSLDIQWQCQSLGDHSEAGQPNKFVLEGNELASVKMLNVFEPCTLQLGDKSFYTVKDVDQVITLNEWNKLQKQNFAKDLEDSSVKRKRKPRLSKAEKHKEKMFMSIDGAEQSRDISVSIPSPPNDIERPLWKPVIEAESRSSIKTPNQAKCRYISQNHALSVRGLKRQKLRKAKSKTHPEAETEIDVNYCGSRLVVETLCTHSRADVVWQDGSIELGIHSGDLIPVHHLDEKEFFPGDFVVKADNKTNTGSLEYGVVQYVNAKERTAVVRWMKSCNPSLTWAETIEGDRSREVSVYDLKDHPDFKFRPGSIVVRVADSADNMAGKPRGSAGQVLDNHTNGQIEVWWVEGFTTLCWPQELYRVGDYDSEAGELWGDESGFPNDSGNVGIDADVDSQDSWETQSEASLIEEDSVDGKIIEEIKNNGFSAVPQEILNCVSTSYIETRSTLQKLDALFAIAEEDIPYSDIYKPRLEEIFGHFTIAYKQYKHLTEIVGPYLLPDENLDELLHKVCHDEGFDELFISIQSSNADQGTTIIKDALEGLQGVSSEDPKSISRPCADAAVSSFSSVSLDPRIDRTKRSIFQMFVRLNKLLQTQVNRLVESSESAVRQYLNPSSSLVEVTTNSSGPILDSASEFCSDEEASKAFSVLEETPTSHKFYSSVFKISGAQILFQKRLMHELALLRSSALPQGINVKTYEDRMDLFSVMIEGPRKTPYEGGLFLFDFQLPSNYPHSPPLCHYWSFTSERLNPNLYEEGKVCVSLLGTWSGKGSETWGSHSNLVQVLISIQALILNSQPYYNEAGYEKLRDSDPQSMENSRLYNEMVLIKVLESMIALLSNPPTLWRSEILNFVQREAPPLMKRYRHWTQNADQMSQSPASLDPDADIDEAYPSFPLFPISKGFCLALEKHLNSFQRLVDRFLLKSSESP